MSEDVIQVAENFWNIRGSFKVAGLVDIGTQASLVRRSDGKFLMLDSYTLSGRRPENTRTDRPSTDSTRSSIAPTLLAMPPVTSVPRDPPSELA